MYLFWYQKTLLFLSQQKILNFLRKQRYNADYELSAKQGADTLAYIALLEEKLLPALLHTFWVEAENYCSVTKPWFASRIPFPLSLYLPGKMSREALNRILLTRGGPPLYSLTEVEAQIYRDAKECLNLLSKRLGTSPFFFGNTPTTLDAFVFGFLAPVYKVCFPRVQLQEHLKQLTNLCRFCDDILTCYFKLTITDPALIISLQMDDNLRKSPQHPPRKITTLKLAAGGGESSPLNRLSPWQLLLHTHICLPSILLNITAIFLTNVVLQGKNLLMGSSREETQLYNILSLIFKKTSSSGLLHAKLKLKY